MIIQSITQITSISRPKYLIILDIVIDNFLYYVKTKREILEVFIIKSVLLITYIFASIIFRFCFKIESRLHKEVLSLKPDRYLIVANHRSAVDPYLILATLPFNSFNFLLPIRFFTANIYFKRWWQRVFLMAFGSFRAYSVAGEISGVKGGLYLSDRGQSLLIFPEGKRNRHKSKLELKIGAAYLIQRRDFTILPVSISYMDNRTQVNWGKPFRINGSLRTKDLNKLTKMIFNRVLQISDRDEII